MSGVPSENSIYTREPVSRLNLTLRELSGKKDDAILKVSRVPKANQAKPEISIPVSDIALVYTDSLGYTTLQLKDYGCVADDPNNISYETVKQIVNSYYVSVREATDSVTVTEPNGNIWSIRK